MVLTRREHHRAQEAGHQRGHEDSSHVRPHQGRRRAARRSKKRCPSRWRTEAMAQSRTCPPCSRRWSTRTPLTCTSRSGVPPEFRIQGKMVKVKVDPLNGAGHQGALLLRPDRCAEGGVREESGARLFVRHQGSRPLPRQPLLSTWQCRRRVSPDSDHRSRTSTQLKLPRSSRRSFERPNGLVLVTGPTGQRQVHHARGHARHPQSRGVRPHHHDRRPDRVRAPAQELRRQPARSRRRHQVLSTPRSSASCARTRTSSWSASFATSRRSRWR